jgi:hypothetical protein
MHFFKPSQPALDLDNPDCQAVRVVNGLALNERWRGARGLRLDADPPVDGVLSDHAAIRDARIVPPRTIPPAFSVASSLFRFFFGEKTEKTGRTTPEFSYNKDDER